MKKMLLLLAAVVLTACGSPVAAQAVIGTPGPTATRTVTPSPTVGWQATAVAAQATADEARRVNAQATAQHEAFELEKIRVTEGAEIREHEKFAGTATAASTSVPLTQTARSVDLTATNAMMTLSAGQLTATHQAPTQVVAMARADLEREWGWVNYAAMGALTFFLFALGVFALARSRTADGPMVTYQQTVGAEAVVNDDLEPIRQDDLTPLTGADDPHVYVVVKKDNGKGGYAEMRYRVPCSNEQLYELAVRVLDDGETLGINNWEGEGTSLTRKAIGILRSYFQEKKLVTSIGAGRLKFNEDGIDLLHTVRKGKLLPHLDLPIHIRDDSRKNMSHESGAHVPAHGGGA